MLSLRVPEFGLLFERVLRILFRLSPGYRRHRPEATLLYQLVYPVANNGTFPWRLFASGGVAAPRNSGAIARRRALPVRQHAGLILPSFAGFVPGRRIASLT
jgi:hypothetical protein